MARYLLDTHALLWWWDASPKLPAKVASVLADRSNTVFVSAVSALEIAIKVRLGKLPQMAPRIGFYQTDVEDDGFVHLTCRPDHAVLAGIMAGKHRDPFDRMLAAQAIIEHLVLITRDREIAAFGCDVIW